MNKIYSNWLKIEDKLILKTLNEMDSTTIDSVFCGTLDFGTAGLRGIMVIGSNRINVVNVCKLANAVLMYFKKKNLSKIVIGYDTRHNSKQYAKVFANVFANGGVNVNLFGEFVPTPVLTYSIQKTKADMGIMITASHNNKDYNGIKISDKNGIQISGDAEKEIGKLYQKLDEVELFNYYIKSKLNKKNIHIMPKSFKGEFLGSFDLENKNINIIYTPLNGTAYKYVTKALKSSGFNNVVVY